MGSPMCASHAVGRAEAGVALSIKRSGIERRNLLAERDCKVTTKTHLYPNFTIYICFL